MKYQRLLCSVLLLFWPHGAKAFGLPGGSLEFALPKSDVVCVGTIKSTSEAGQNVFRLGPHALIDCQDASAEVSVEAVLSGHFSGTRFHLNYPAYPAGAVHKGMSFPSNFYPHVVAGERAMFFLSKATGDGADTFSFFSPFARPAPIVPIGESSLAGILTAATPLRRVALTLTRGLDVPDKTIQLDCLQRLNVIGNLLYVMQSVHKPGTYDDEYELKNRLAFGEAVLTPESVASSLEEFVKAQILPTVLKLTTASDTDLSEQAVITAGSLQDVGVIPKLVNIADRHYEAPLAIGNYRTGSAVRPLINALASKNDDVRAQAAYALRNFADPLAVPFLLDHLEDPNPDAQYYIVTALFTATDTPQYPGTQLFHDKTSDYIALWKKWATDHQDKIKALRAQFDAETPANASP